MAVAVIADFETLALAIGADTSPALITVRARPSIIQILVKRSDFTAERLSLPLGELGVIDCCISISSFDSLSEFINPSVLSSASRKVTGGNHVDFQVTLLLSDVPIAVV